MTDSPSSEQRRRAYRRGQFAEAVCAWMLRLHGYKILARRFKTQLGEIDLIARRGHLIVFIEVKQRATVSAALQAVTDQQSRRIAQAAGIFIAKYPAFATHDQRFDIMAVSGKGLPKHIKNAW